jgi:hypothetical protein
MHHFEAVAHEIVQSPHAKAQRTQRVFYPKTLKLVSYSYIPLANFAALRDIIALAKAPRTQRTFYILKNP